MTAADYLDVVDARVHWIASVAESMQGFDAMLLPTVPVNAPSIEMLEGDDEFYYAMNALILRNSTLINFLDGCALSLPNHAKGHAPTGLTVAGLAMQDAQILKIGQSIEAALANY